MLHIRHLHILLLLRQYNYIEFGNVQIRYMVLHYLLRYHNPHLSNGSSLTCNALRCYLVGKLTIRL